MDSNNCLVFFLLWIREFIWGKIIEVVLCKFVPLICSLILILEIVRSGELSDSELVW